MQKNNTKRIAAALIRYYAGDSVAVVRQRINRAMAVGDAKEERLWRQADTEIRSLL